MKKTFAQLKRDLTEGVKVRTLLNVVKPEKNGQERTIKKTQTNAIVFNDDTSSSGESWLWWGKASTIQYEDNVFEITEGGQTIFKYEIVK